MQKTGAALAAAAVLTVTACGGGEPGGAGGEVSEDGSEPGVGRVGSAPGGKGATQRIVLAGYVCPALGAANAAGKMNLADASARGARRSGR